MIRVLMLGRLGNNLFQYALGRVLAQKHGVELVLDGAWFDNAGWSQVECIKRLPIRATVTRRLSLPKRALRKITGKHPWHFLKVPQYVESTIDHSFSPLIWSAPADCFVMGYFQSPWYFQDIEDSLRREIDPSGALLKSPPASLVDQLSKSGSIAVHVRRGDFIGSSVFQVCDDSYYRKAMARMQLRVPNCHFYIFSDDTEWCCEHFRGDDFTVVSLPERLIDPLLDLHLMSLANHHIIANSTYSWWAAWIGKKATQIVICPTRWFNASIDAPMSEKLCDHWEMIE
jgi:hypothetical protein